jgi:hypothetical protein
MRAIVVLIDADVPLIAAPAASPLPAAVAGAAPKMEHRSLPVHAFGGVGVKAAAAVVVASTVTRVGVVEVGASDLGRVVPVGFRPSRMWKANGDAAANDRLVLGRFLGWSFCVNRQRFSLQRQPPQGSCNCTQHCRPCVRVQIYRMLLRPPLSC